METYATALLITLGVGMVIAALGLVGSIRRDRRRKREKENHHERA